MYFFFFTEHVRSLTHFFYSVPFGDRGSRDFSVWRPEQGGALLHSVLLCSAQTITDSPDDPGRQRAVLFVGKEWSMGLERLNKKTLVVTTA